MVSPGDGKGEALSDRQPSRRSLPVPPAYGGPAVDVDVPRSLITTTPAAGGDDRHAVSFEKTPFVSLPSLVGAVRRRWRLVTATALAGVAAAVVLSLVYPPSHSATTVLLLRHPNSANPTRAMAHDAELLETRTVAQGAIRRLGLDVRPDNLVSDYAAVPLSDELMQITVNGPSGAEAVRRADAVAHAFLDFRENEFERQWQVVMTALQEREDELQSQLDSVVKEISALEASADVGSVRPYGDLLSRRADLSKELKAIRQRMEDGARETRTVVGQSRIIDVASKDERSPLKVLAANVAAGAVGGLGLGVGLVMVHAATSDRVRWREDVAAALGAPVAVSAGALRGPLWAQRWRFRRHRSRPNDDLSRIARHLEGSLTPFESGKRAVTVVSIESDAAAALCVASLAVELLEADRKILIADLSGTWVFGRFFRLPRGDGSPVPVEEIHPKLWVSFGAPAPPHPLKDHQAEPDLESRSDADVVVTLVTVDPALGVWPLIEGTGSAVAVVTAGRSRPTALRSAAHMLRGAGLFLDSTVLIGTDRDDDTVGAPR